MSKNLDEKSKAQRAVENLEARAGVRNQIIEGSWKVEGGQASITLDDAEKAAALQREIGSLLGAVPRMVGNTIILRENHLKAARKTITANKSLQN